MRHARQLFVLLSAGLLLIFLAAGNGWPQSPINTDGHGLALKGYDVVAYFTMGKPVKGDSRYSYAWQGAIWRFANVRHLEAFKAAPAKYAPQYGGY